MAGDKSDSSKVVGNDLLIIGPGVLGRLVGQLWLKESEGGTVVGQTNTTEHHEEIRSLGIVPVEKGARNVEKFPYVIFCAPPASSDYPAEVRAGAQRWNGKGSLLFTSSSALYDVADNGICDEKNAPTVPKGRGARTDNLLSAEEEVLKLGGNVVRLGGLYFVDLHREVHTLNHGVHVAFLRKGVVESRPDYVVNVIHYEDAATLCISILKGQNQGHIFMGCDNVPLTSQEIMDAANESGKYERKFEKFTGVDGPLGKRMNNDLTRLVTGWKPKYESIKSFFRTASHAPASHDITEI